MRAGDLAEEGAPASSNGGKSSDTAAEAEKKDMPANARHDGPLYSPADRHGNFSTTAAEDEVRRPSHADYDLEELDPDPSERRPGGPVAEAVHAMGAGARRMKWTLPVALFLAAFLVQSIGVCIATYKYVNWMANLSAQYEAEAPRVLRVNLTGDQPRALDFATDATHRASLHKLANQGQLLRRYNETTVEIANSLRLPDSFAEWLGQGTSELMPALLDMLSGVVVPVLWAHDAIVSRNLRLWTRTLLVGSIIVALKGLLAWATTVPDSEGLRACQERLQGSPLQFANPVLDFITVIWHILLLWVSSVFYGIVIPLRRFIFHTHPKDFVCADMFLSGPTSLCALFSLGLYDVARTTTRKQKPHFRFVYRSFAGLILTFIVVKDGLAQVTTGRQYTMDVVLALVLTMLLYSSPVIAICVDRWLLCGSLLSHSDTKDPCDKGDVVIPPCCLPFCCVHGRYFLYSTSVREAEAALRNQAATLAEDIRLQQEEAAQRVLELEASIESEWQRAEEDSTEAEKRLQEALAESAKAFEHRVSRGLRQLDEQVQAEKHAAKQMEKQAIQELENISQVEDRIKEERRQLMKEVASSGDVVKLQREAEATAKALADQELEHVRELQRSIGEVAPDEHEEESAAGSANGGVVDHSGDTTLGITATGSQEGGAAGTAAAGVADAGLKEEKAAADGDSVDSEEFELMEALGIRHAR